MKSVSCVWLEPRCQSTATHWHPAYGQLCGYHARVIEEKHGKKCKHLRAVHLKTAEPDVNNPAHKW